MLFLNKHDVLLKSDIPNSIKNFVIQKNLLLLFVKNFELIYLFKSIFFLDFK